jgi:transcription-repair coupling factor (superfamily II helicase)
LGSGIKIAMRDLEIRGAGNLLGAQQHGHMEAVGYDLYCKMLNQAVRSLKNPEDLQENYDTLIDMTLDAYIPEYYIPDETQKLDMYKKIASITGHEEYEDMQDELIDRYGEPPKSVQYLLDIALLKAQAHQTYITELAAKPQKIVLTIYEKAPAKAEKLAGFLSKYRGRLRMQVQKSPQLVYTPVTGKSMAAKDMFDICQQILQDLKDEIF